MQEFKFKYLEVVTCRTLKKWLEMNTDSHQPLADDEILATLMEDQSRSDEHEDVEDVEGFSDEEQN